MVFIKHQARIDLDEIVVGLLKWEKATLSVPKVMQYVDDIVDVCYQLDNAVYHYPAKYKNHLEYGSYSYPYKRNKSTTWYIIYNIDTSRNIYVNKIISNYLTTS
ncbi:MAG: hypothetical protein FWG79_05500 [Bacteroidales bacterium]|nr:hypothetical protein [Bacteroidales bacterium]